MTKIKNEVEKLCSTISIKELKENKSLQTLLARIKKAIELLGETRPVNRSILKYLDARSLGLTLV